MSFNDQEVSVSSGSLFELYKVSYQFNSWYYTSGDETFEDGAVTYIAAPIDRSAIKMTGNGQVKEFSVMFPLDAEFLNLFHPTPPTGLVTITVHSVHRTDGMLEKRLLFKGSVVEPNWEDSHVELLCETSAQSLKQMGLRMRYQLGCPHMLYGTQGCKVNRQLHQHEGFASNIMGNSVDILEVAGQHDDNHFAGGFIEFTHPVLSTIETVSVVGSDGATGRMELFFSPSGLMSGMPIKVFDGCNRTLDHCHNKFANSPNFGGAPFIPLKDLFGTNPIF